MIKIPKIKIIKSGNIIGDAMEHLRRGVNGLVASVTQSGLVVVEELLTYFFFYTLMTKLSGPKAIISFTNVLYHKVNLIRFLGHVSYTTRPIKLCHVCFVKEGCKQIANLDNFLLTTKV